MSVKIRISNANLRHFEKKGLVVYNVPTFSVKLSAPSMGWRERAEGEWGCGGLSEMGGVFFGIKANIVIFGI